MGCMNSSSNRIEVVHLFNSNEQIYLTESWNIVKAHHLRKFAEEILIRSMNKSSSLRQFLISKIIVEGNNYDYSQSESCLRTDLSWHIGLREYSLHFGNIFDHLLSLINDETNLNAQLRATHFPEDISLLEYESVLILKQSFMDILRERFEKSHLDFTIEHEKSWEKFLSFIIRSITKEGQSIREPTQIILSTNTNHESSAGDKVN